MLKDYYYTDKEELEALRKENAKLKKISDLVLDHIIYDKEGVAQYIEAKPLLALLDKLNEQIL